MVGRDGTGRDKIVRECKTVVKDVLVVESRPVDNIVHRYDLLSHPVVKKKTRILPPRRRENLNLPSRPVVKKSIYCPVPTSRTIFTVPALGKNLPLPFRPAVAGIPVSL